MYVRRVVRPPSYVHERAYVYAIPVVDPRTDAYEPYGYIGQTVRTPEVRLAEHRETQCWAWSIRPPGIVILWSGTCTQQQLDDLEREAIKRFKPLYNIDMNMNNERRIKPWEARDHATVRGFRPSTSRVSSGRALSAFGPGLLAFFLTVLALAVCLSIFS